MTEDERPINPAHEHLHEMRRKMVADIDRRDRAAKVKQVRKRKLKGIVGPR